MPKEVLGVCVVEWNIGRRTVPYTVNSPCGIFQLSGPLISCHSGFESLSVLMVIMEGDPCAEARSEMDEFDAAL